MSPDEPLLRLEGITKRFGDLVANDAVSLAVAPGEVVAMLGENGAGKSTLMKVVYGLLRPDGGVISMEGRELDIRSPRDAMAAGIGMVTQEFSLVETMTVTENVALSSVGLGRVDVRAARRRVLEAMDHVGVHIEPERLVSTLSIGERQRVEIVKALFHECRVLILDEPTAVLTPQDVRALFATVERLRGSGMGVLFVSHKLREVAEISDRVVVLRRGALVGERVTEQVSSHELAGLMMGIAATPDEDTKAAVGLSADHAEPGAVRQEARSTADRAPVLEVADVTVEGRGRPRLDHVSLQVMPGEIVGLAGISGNGQTELMEVLVGATTPSSGRVVVDGTDVTGLDVVGRLAAGLGRLTENRRGSVVPQLSLEQNLVLEDLGSFTTRRGILDQAAVRRHAQRMIEQFDIRATPTDQVATLSGGNVQKVLLARALARRPRVLVVAQPTRGLDVGAYRYVHTQLQELREDGRGVLVISEDLDELRSLCDRILVLFRGSLTGEVAAGQATGDRLGALMTGEAAAS
ncbi:MAG TPA: ABC transporter ATP-binding protein [Nocardioidaceae bacterium]|nr:ABC transporter ATP-binding protein [Nocardioidaceae bacterium]